MCLAFFVGSWSYLIITYPTTNVEITNALIRSRCVIIIYHNVMNSIL